MLRQNHSRWLLLTVAAALFVATLAMLRGPASEYFFKRGLLYKQEWHLDQATRNFEWALRFKSDFDEARFEKALCHQLRGDFLSAGRELDLLAAKDTQERGFRARLLNAAGVNHFNSSEAEAATEAHDRSLELAKRLGDKRLEAQALIGLSRVLYHLKGQSDKALDHLEEALRIGRELGDESIEAHALRNIGVVYWWFKGEFDRPLTEYYLPALEIYRRNNDLHSAAITLGNIGFVYGMKGDSFQALKYQNESLELRHRTGDMAGLSDSYFTLGTMYNDIENYRRAREYFLKSLELSRDTGYRLTQNDVEIYLADIHVKLGEYDQAITLFNRLLEREQQNPLMVKYRLVTLARCYMLKGEPEMARQYYDRALEIDRQIGSPDSRFIISTLTMLGEVYTRSGNFEKASEALARAREMSLGQREALWSWGLYNNLVLAELIERQGQRARALDHLLEAADIDLQQTCETLTQFAAPQNRLVYDRLFTLLLEPAGRDESSPDEADLPRLEDELAFRFLEQLRYRSLRNFVVKLSDKKADTSPSRREEADALSQIERLSRELKDRDGPLLKRQLRQAYSDYEDTVLRSELARPRYMLVREARPAELEAVRLKLDSETALIEYLFVKDKVFALIITRALVRSVALPVTRPNLSAKVKLLRSLIFNGAQRDAAHQPGYETQKRSAETAADWQPVAQDLHRVLIEPLEKSFALDRIRRLGVIPFGFLHDLPFAALARREGEGLRFLVEDYSIFRAPSATFLTHVMGNSSNRANERSSPQKLAMLSMGRNESDEPELLPLRFAAEEAREVARIFGGDVRVEERASESEFNQLAHHFRYIHLATHAVSEAQMPLLSRLKLQSTREDDGNLTIREILDLDLQAELVTLGACQTGQSYSSSGNDTSEVDRIGLIEAFLHAGTGSVLASLLPISDRPTIEFMKSFYGNLQSKDKAEALADTQRAMLRGELFYMEEGRKQDLSHPRYWAPFILAGDYR